MSSLTGFVKRIRDIMWNDAGVNGDAQRIEQMAWILFLKVYNTKEEEGFRHKEHTAIRNIQETDSAAPAIRGAKTHSRESA